MMMMIMIMMIITTVTMSWFLCGRPCFCFLFHFLFSQVSIGALLLAERLDGAAGISAEVAHRKARTSAVTRRPTKFWEDRAKDRPGFLTFPADIMLQGGVPLMWQGECVGAVGVSGVQSLEDEQIALAGVAALGT